MDITWLILTVVVLVVLVTVVYPWVQEQREKALLKRLGERRDPLAAILEMEALSRQHRHEAIFFRTVARYIALLFR